jgi:hypothetical protein
VPLFLLRPIDVVVCGVDPHPRVGVRDDRRVVDGEEVAHAAQAGRRRYEARGLVLHLGVSPVDVSVWVGVYHFSRHVILLRLSKHGRYCSPVWSV